VASPPGPPGRVLLGAFGDPGHAFPMIALGRALRARGHEVTLQTWRRWRANVQGEGLSFAPAPEYEVFPTGGPGGEPLDFYEAVVHATRDTLPLVRELRPDVVVADILTLAPALAAEIAGIPHATLIPHVYPENEPDAPVYSLGARLPRTVAGRALWRCAQRPVRRAVERASAWPPSHTATAAPVAGWRSSPPSRSSSIRAHGHPGRTWWGR
jgi:Glycosyltransferase family 28 N-terminal domain